MSHVIILECGAEPTEYTNKLECADGTLENTWNGCVNKGSYRVRCPYPYIPCHDMRSNGVEFFCGTTCNSRGGKRKCSGGNTV